MLNLTRCKVDYFDDLKKMGIFFINSTADVTLQYSHPTYLDLNEPDLRKARSVEDGV